MSSEAEIDRCRCPRGAYSDYDGPWRDCPVHGEKSPIEHAIGQIAEGLASAIEMQSWDIVDSYRHALVALSEGKTMFGNKVRR